MVEAIIIGVSIMIAGCCISEGLKRQGSKQSEADYYYFLKEHELVQYVNLSAEEIAQLLKDRPDVPKVVINGKTYYPSKPFQHWLTTL